MIVPVVGYDEGELCPCWPEMQCAVASRPREKRRAAVLFNGLRDARQGPTAGAIARHCRAAEPVRPIGEAPDLAGLAARAVARESPGS